MCRGCLDEPKQLCLSSLLSIEISGAWCLSTIFLILGWAKVPLEMAIVTFNIPFSLSIKPSYKNPASPYSLVATGCWWRRNISLARAR